MKLGNSIITSERLQLLNKYSGIGTALVFTIWGMILRFKAFANRDLWVDEIIQIKMTLEPLKPLWLRENAALDITSFPGDYLLIYPFVKLFGASKLVAIPHAIITLLGFYLLYLLCKHYFRTAFGYLVAFVLLCFNDILIFHAFEIRPYSVLPTFALACFYFAKDVISGNNSNNRQRSFVIILFVITILFHPFGVAIAFFVFATVVVARAIALVRPPGRIVGVAMMGAIRRIIVTVIVVGVVPR